MAHGASCLAACRMFLGHEPPGEPSAILLTGGFPYDKTLGGTIKNLT